MLSKSIATLVPCLMSFCSAASISGIATSDKAVNNLQRRDVGPYTWCGIQIEYDAEKPKLALGWNLAWTGMGYNIIPTGAVTSGAYTPPLAVRGGHLAAMMTVSGDNFGVYIGLKVAPTGEIQGIGVIGLTVDKKYPTMNPTFGFQCKIASAYWSIRKVQLRRQATDAACLIDDRATIPTSCLVDHLHTVPIRMDKMLSTKMIAAAVLSLAGLCSAASIQTDSIKARGPNMLERRHDGEYTWCGIQIKYDAAQPPLAIGWNLEWLSDTYDIVTNDVVTAGSCSPPETIGDTLVPAIMDVAGKGFSVSMELRIDSDGDIQGIGRVTVQVNGKTPTSPPQFGFQCSSDPGQLNKITIPAY
ncbi:hypothetical protein E5Q_01099 [Mixia osmundae IAM 14324]|uniref:Uncharacterized protein n=1 Tax=Mixia osmundae (strain CBS 9802 / IAM 14324 / JCM 22182 / KY 12970) TaxID=764103 RepID=G7DV37_MIXOS|nr:hypothetical protein E5Q_01099 [Mixia osmundae IAM 14324]